MLFVARKQEGQEGTDEIWVAEKIQPFPNPVRLLGQWMVFDDDGHVCGDVEEKAKVVLTNPHSRSRRGIVRIGALIVPPEGLSKQQKET